ncbi:MAG: hypothetical protein JST22_13355 [Bacteroidetes bacterium]|nr:hypothetical protein [Bacteroidota bacterium]
MTSQHQSEITPDALMHEAAQMLEVVDGSAQLSIQWIVQRNWTVAPVGTWVDAGSDRWAHFLERDAERIVRAISLRYNRALYSIPTHGGSPESVRTLTCETDAFVQFGIATRGKSYLLVPDDFSFAVLCSRYNYNLIAGPYSFVYSCLGTTFMAAHIDFHSEVNSADDADCAAELKMVENRYASYLDVSSVEGGEHSDLDSAGGLRSLLHDDHHFSIDWLRERNWVGVPVDEGYCRSATFRERLLATACRNAIYEGVLGIVNPNLNDLVRIHFTTDVLSYMSPHMHAYSYLIATQPLVFAVLFTHDDYCVVAGVRRCVESILGCSVDAAIVTFRERYARGLTGNEHYDDALMKLPEYYSLTLRN